MDGAALTTIARLLADAKVAYVVIGAHAVNAWLEPRFTRDVDVTIDADPAAVARVREVLATRGYTVVIEHGGDLPSGPDFVRFTSADRIVTLEIQTAKTAFQREAIARAVARDDLRVATPEDLIVFKLIANRSKDRIDLEGLVALGGLDWTYVDRWAQAWGVHDELERLRSRSK